MTALNQKLRLFVEAYDGNDVEAARIAGYSGSDAYLKRKAADLLARPEVATAIRDRQKYRLKVLNLVADRDERQALWTAVMRNEDPHRKPEVDAYNNPIPEGNIPLPIRLKAAELLGKSEGDFVDTLNVTGNLTITDIIKKSYDKTLTAEDHHSLEEIEAAYTVLHEAAQPASDELPPEPHPNADALLPEFLL